ncbi:MAG: D-sedoheptulose 7-phosphate isomerase [Anaerolineales bacterium]|nr:D-sedoheptulose 7-phosphate isomerase [Anaerolineales bacterium]MDW8227734.1 D-sedoheptulose 7-phosphate isomerase [Anaerolineales bacterium]
MFSTIQSELQAHQAVLEQTVAREGQIIKQITAALIDCFQRGNKLLICGNGGSAADAQHVAGEFVNRFRFDHAPLPAIALTTDTSILTAVGNDASFEFIFSRQVEALGRPGDVLVGISTSGRSSNVLRALEAARRLGLMTIGFTGEKGAQHMSPLCDLCLAIPSDETPRIQEAHIFAWHVICGQIENTLFSSPPET